jgi:hypothetical protein
MELIFRQVRQKKNITCVAVNQMSPQNIRKASLYSISFRKLLFPSTVEMALARCREQNEQREATRATVKHVGMIPLRANKAGNPSMAGPVIEFTAIDTEPTYN